MHVTNCIGIYNYIYRYLIIFLILYFVCIVMFLIVQIRPYISINQ